MGKWPPAPPALTPANLPATSTTAGIHLGSVNQISPLHSHHSAADLHDLSPGGAVAASGGKHSSAAVADLVSAPSLCIFVSINIIVWMTALNQSFRFNTEV